MQTYATPSGKNPSLLSFTQLSQTAKKMFAFYLSLYYYRRELMISIMMVSNSSAV